MATRLQAHADKLADEANKSGVPRQEADAEVMTEVQRDRAANVGRTKFHQGVAVGAVPAYRNATRSGRRGAEL